MTLLEIIGRLVNLDGESTQNLSHYIAKHKQWWYLKYWLLITYYKFYWSLIILIVLFNLDLLGWLGVLEGRLDENSLMEFKVLILSIVLSLHFTMNRAWAVEIFHLFVLPVLYLDVVLLIYLQKLLSWYINPLVGFFLVSLTFFLHQMSVDVCIYDASLNEIVLPVVLK